MSISGVDWEEYAFLDEEEKEDEGTKTTLQFQNSTYEIVSKTAYLLGVPKRIFENEYEAPQIEVFERLEQDQSARIIRNLSVVRTAIEQNFKLINDKMRAEYCSILSMPQYIPSESIRQLNEDGVDFIKRSSTKLYQHIIEINRLICDRINNCKHLFPLWLNWQYIRELCLLCQTD